METCEEWYPNDSSVGNIALDGCPVPFILKKLDKLSLSPVGPTSPQDPRGLLILQPRALALCYLPTIMRLWQCLPLGEAPCLSFPLASRDFIHHPGSPQRWPDLKWPRAKDTQSCVEAASLPLGEEGGGGGRRGGGPQRAQVLKQGSRGGRSSVFKDEKCLEILLPAAVMLCVV